MLDRIPRKSEFDQLLLTLLSRVTDNGGITRSVEGIMKRART